MLKNIFKVILVAIAVVIALSYTFGYDYLFKGIRETYLRGEIGSTIDDGGYFRFHTIAKGPSIPWAADSLYNKKPLPKVLVDHLNQTSTASFLVIINGKLRHEQYWPGYSKSTSTNSFSKSG